MATKTTTRAKGREAAKDGRARQGGAAEVGPRPGEIRPGLRLGDIFKDEAATILGISREQVNGLAERGYLTVYRLPGCRPKFIRAEVEELARRSLVPATAGVVRDED